MKTHVYINKEISMLDVMNKFKVDSALAQKLIGVYGLYEPISMEALIETGWLKKHEPALYKDFIESDWYLDIEKPCFLTYNDDEVWILSQVLLQKWMWVCLTDEKKFWDYELYDTKLIAIEEAIKQGDYEITNKTDLVRIAYNEFDEEF